VILADFLAGDDTIEVDFNTFTRDRNNDANNADLAPLKAARVVIASESGKYEKLNVAKIKLLTGGNEIRCAFKFRDHFQYRPQFKIWLVSNHDINADPDDDAAWGRLVRIEFPHSFLGQEDKTLKTRMKQPDNLQSVLTWAVQGAIRWYARSEGLVTPEALIQGTQQARSELDLVGQWLADATIDPPNGGRTRNAIAYGSYEYWCEQQGHKPVSGRSFSQALRQKGVQPYKTNSERGWILRLRNDQTDGSGQE
jgi:putative DNA primase/helicase